MPGRRGWYHTLFQFLRAKMVRKHPAAKSDEFGEGLQGPLPLDFVGRSRAVSDPIAHAATANPATQATMPRGALFNLIGDRSSRTYGILYSPSRMSHRTVSETL
jgi:hypothetical protein